MAPPVQLTVTTAEQRDREGVVTARASTYASQLAWTEHTLSYDGASGQRIVLDFASRWQREINEHARTMTTWPLQSLISFRALEARNRGQHIYEVLKAGGVADNDFAPLLAEHQLGVSFPASPRRLSKRSLLGRLARRSELEIVERRSHTDLMAGTRCLVSIARDGHARPDALPAFTQFLRCAFGGHPVLLQHIREAEQLPAWVTVRHLTPMHDGGEITIRVVESAAAARVTSYDGFDENPPLDGSDPIDVVLQSAIPPARRSIEERCTEALALIQGAAPFPGLLTFFELTLEQPLEMPRAIAEAIRTSPDKIVPGFPALVQPPSGVDETRALLNVFQRLRDHAGRMAYVLGAFEAPLHQVLNERLDAIAVLTKLVEANPRATAAWKDLGDLFVPAYDLKRAWLCW